MGRGFLQLNELDMILRVERGAVTRSVGISHVSSTGIVSGDVAWEKFWIEPQHCYTQYWRQFNQRALTAAKAGIRHHADLAFHQLQQMQQSLLTGDDGGTGIDQLLIAAPSHFNDEQLSLLLALAQSLDFPVCSFIDPAVVAVASAVPIPAESLQRIYYVDMQFHQCVLIELLSEEGRWVKGESIALADCGLLQLLQTQAHFLADLAIREHRFDPLKIATSSQILHEQIHSQLLYQDRDFTLEMHTEHSHLNCRVNVQLWNSSIQNALGALLELIDSKVDQNSAVCLAQTTQWLQQHISVPVHTVTEKQISDHVFACWSSTVSDELLLIDTMDQLNVNDSQLGAASKSERNRRNPKQSSVGNLPRSAATASHILVNNIAYSLRSGVWFVIDDSVLRVHALQSEDAELALSLEREKLLVQWREGGVTLNGVIGESFVLCRQRISFISVEGSSVSSEPDDASSLVSAR